MAETKSVILDSLTKWARELIQSLLPLIDARALVLIVGSGVGGWLVFPQSIMPTVKTAAAMVLALVFSAGVVHLIRKILLSKGFDLIEYANKAKESAIGSALVFVAVLAFVGALILSITNAILPK